MFGNSVSEGRDAGLVRELGEAGLIASGPDTQMHSLMKSPCSPD